ncbi:Receptor-like protein kinase [Melia azedarach]|uniref:Receptor-like protein kinase n=1 Tax=Melia azedarach TaxID=155640 RepID=A0ACC1WVS0_MELAZ|nr:Receptor-like protein kinase [Melia azedarach]
MHNRAIGFKNLLLILFCMIISIGSFINGQECDDSTRNIANSSVYIENRNAILSSLASKVIISGGFYTASIGQDPNKVYALALCRGDSSSADCAGCVNSASKDIISKCPNHKEAIAWGADAPNPPCIVRYADRYFVGKLELSPIDAGSNLENITWNLTQFNQTWKSLMDVLVKKASMGSSRLKFATGEAKVTYSEQIYALMQCTPDISQSDCEICLRQSMAAYESCCHGKQGGLYERPNCIFRWEIFRFFGATNEALLRTPSPESSVPPESTNKKITKVAKTIETAEPYQFNFSAVKVATNNFSNENKLGQGGFGAVYKGKLPNGRDIAVKRLSRDSGQGELEFKNEVLVLTMLQHRNLVRLLGFCLKGNERLLIYEFVPNSSLDNFIFDPIKHLQLDWEMRYKIIVGIARGILYLHDDSRLRIIHRDLKASNILLDLEMNPKLSDFGMARLFDMDQTQGNTSRIVGTFGYMAPEYVKRGHFSIKSDVFSFGVLVLEIISGQKNSCFCKAEQEAEEDLLTYTWRNWKEGTAAKIIDPSLRVDSNDEVMRCIQIGLLCVQENIANRPTMASVVLMLTRSMSLLVPSQPAYFMHPAPAVSDQSKSDSDKCSVNWASITQLNPR